TRGSDAFCVVVSEETGTVSVAKNGKLSRDIDSDRLRKYLAGVVCWVTRDLEASNTARLR
ncbi:MAG: TIGR00159 family protein, partial [Planctomycetota bacterium]